MGKVITPKMNKSEMDYCGSKLILSYGQKRIVKEQRVYGNWDFLQSKSLRCILVDYENFYHIRDLSNNNKIKKKNFFSTKKNTRSGFSDGEAWICIIWYKKNSWFKYMLILHNGIII